MERLFTPNIAPDIKFRVPWRPGGHDLALAAAAERSMKEGKRAILEEGEWFPTVAMVPFRSNRWFQMEGVGDGQTIFRTDGLVPTGSGETYVGPRSLVYVQGTVWAEGQPLTGVPAGGVPSLVADVPAGSWVLELTSTAGLDAGHIIIIRDGSQPIFHAETGLPLTFPGQQVRIKHLGTRSAVGATAVDTATKITLTRATEFDYHVGTTVRRNIVAPGPFLSNFTLYRDAPIVTETTLGIPSTALALDSVYDTRIEGLKIDGLDHTALRFSNAFKFSVVDHNAVKMASQNNANAPYPLCISNGSHFGSVVNLHAQECRHAITTTSTDTNQIEVAHIEVNGVVAAGCSHAAVDSHPASRELAIYGAVIGPGDLRTGSSQPGAGIQLRGRRQKAVNPHISGVDTGVVFAYGEDNTLDGGDINSCRVAISINTAERTKIVSHIRARDIREDLITIRRDGALSSQPSIAILAEFSVSGRVPTSYINVISPATYEKSWDIARGARFKAKRHPATKFINVPAWAVGNPRTPHATKFDNFDGRLVSSSAITALEAGKMKMCLIENIPQGELLSKVWCLPAGTATNPRHFWMALLDIDRNVIGRTADLLTTNPGASALYGMDLLLYATQGQAVAAAGSGYRVNDIVTLSGGTLAGTTGTPARLRVASLTSSGLATFEVLDPGFYWTLPSSPASTTSTLWVTNPVPSAGGSGYAVGQVLRVVGGAAIIPATVRVTSVSAGAITGLEVVEPGTYSALPASPASVSGGGSGATVAFTGASGSGATISFTSAAAAYTAEYDGSYYVGIVSDADTPPTMRAVPGVSSFMASTPIKCGTSGTGLVVPGDLPAVAAAITPTANLPWVGVS